MIMTAELNSHQRISYYTGVKLIRHNQHNNSSNNTNNGNNTNPTSNGGSSTTTGGGFYQHNQHHHPSQQQQQGQHRYPPPPPHPQHRHQQAQHHPPPHLTPHHPSHFHLPCPTGPPHIQHPGGAPLHLKNHGPPLPNNHQGNPQSYGPGNNGGSNQTTRLYTGSPLIRSTTYNSTFGSIGGSGANHKRSYRHHHHNRNHQNSHSHHSNNGRQGSFHLNQHNHHHHPHQNIIGGSCSSGTSSSSSSNEHLNHLQSPTEKLDISPLKLSSSSPPSHEESSSSPSSLSSNSSPGPQGSPSPSSGSPSSTDGNKDLDHFYFLEEHWKPTSDGNSSIGNSSHDSTRDIIIMDMSSSMSSSSHSSGSSGQWISSGSSGGGSPSPPIPPTPATTMTMMVDQFFATGGGIGDGGHNNNNFAGLEVDCNNNVVTAEHPDFADLGMPPPHGDQQQQHRFLYQDNYNSFNGCSGVIGAGCIGGSSGLINFGGRKVNGDQNEILSSVPSSTTVVNVETQIGTFNGQRDLEIRLCFIKGDNHLGGNVQGNTGENFLHGKDTDFVRENCEKNPIIGDPFANNDKSPGSQNSSQAKQGKNVSQDMEQLSLGQSQKVSPLN